MAFVHVENGRLHPQSAEHAHPADAQQNLLHDAGGAVATIDSQGQIAKVLLVFRTIGVQQIS